MANYFYCEYCGGKFSSMAALTNMHCNRHPDGVNKGYHKLYEGSEKSKYMCKYCGLQSSSIQSLVATHCVKHPNGVNKGYHSPAL